MDPREPETYRSAVPIVQPCLKKDSSPIFSVIFAFMGTARTHFQMEKPEYFLKKLNLSHLRKSLNMFLFKIKESVSFKYILNVLQ